MLKLFMLCLIALILHGKENVKIASINWCPQMCEDSEQKGYVVDILHAVFKDSPFNLRIKTYPWSRAINLANNADVIALLAPAKNEAPNLLYPKEPIGHQQMCFFIKNDSKWKYEGTASLKEVQVGVAVDASLEELDAYINKNKSQFQYMPYNEDYVYKSIKKLERNRIDTFIFTKNTTLYKLNHAEYKSKYKIAGCVSKANIYIAFTPKAKKKSTVDAMMRYYDKNIVELKNDGTINGIMEKYGLKGSF